MVSKETITAKVNVILDHFIEIGSREILGRSRGMIVVNSRKDCVSYFKEINKQLEERKINFRALTAFSGEVILKGDETKYTETSLNQEEGHQGDIPQGLKNPKYRSDVSHVGKFMVLPVHAAIANDRHTVEGIRNNGWRTAFRRIVRFGRAVGPSSGTS